jgi:site-specific DNA-methyltransferase (adenine-specific)
MGHDLSHQNEAPFPLGLAEFFVKSFCPPGGVVLDLFAGSSTTGHAAIKNGRRYIGSDLRESQVELSARRLREVELEMRGQSEVAGGCAGGGGGDPAAPVGEPGGAVCAAVGGG